jgi:hypothetical protein
VWLVYFWRLKIPLHHRPSGEATGFPHLKELFLTLITMKDRDLAFLLDRSHVLEVLTIISSQTDMHLYLVSHSLRYLQLGMSSLGDIVVVDAPCLEKLLLWMPQRRRTGGNKFSRALEVHLEVRNELKDIAFLPQVFSQRRDAPCKSKHVKLSSFI